ncbi:glycohydrolase toxin TNT-related protein [Arthrobacter sp. NPDC056493]|uniref:glycohydrolase toxin TNT-related protein n=1 Tax=Arthrobacter sp. NPDC056493 TaxID=3345839 RepID=UPI003672EC78
MSSGFAEVCTIGAGASGIDAGGLPPLPDADALETHATALAGASASISAGVNAASRTWTGLSGAYEAPEQGVVLSGFSPIAYRAASLQGITEQCSAALRSFAGRTRDLKLRVEALRAEVSALDELILGNDDWQSKIDIVDQRRETYDRCSALAQDILDSDAACASALNVLAGGEKVSAAVIPRQNLNGSTDVLSNVFSNVQHFLGSDQEIADQPWGPANVSLRAGGLASLGQGALAAVVGAGQGLYTLLGTTDKEQQVRAWQGLGMLAGAALTTHRAISRADGKFSAEELNAMLTVGDAVKGAVYYDEWGKDPWYAAGGATVDVAGLFAGGAGVGLKAGTAASKAGMAAEKMGAAATEGSRLGRLAPALGSSADALGTAGAVLSKPGSVALKISDVVMPETTAKLLDKLADVRVEGPAPSHTPDAPDLPRTGIAEGNGPAPLRHEDARVARPGAAEESPAPRGEGAGDAPDDDAKAVAGSSEVPGERVPHVDDEPKPEDALYGLPRDVHAEHSPYPAITDVNRETMELVSDPQAPWGRAPEGTPFSKAEYDERYTKPGREGAVWSEYPPNAGRVQGTGWDYMSLKAFVRDYGGQVDRIGDSDGSYLGLIEDGVPASFEDRSLPVASLEKAYSTYRLVEDWPPGAEGWTIEVSKIAPAFGREGGAMQLQIMDNLGKPVPVDSLLDEGVLTP